MTDHEKTGENFKLDDYLKAREICIAATEEIIARVEPGMNEKQGQLLTIDVFKSHGVRKFWHAIKFRIGKDTMKDFSEKPEPSLLTQNGDLCFVDVGPIINDYEADFGRTFVVGGSGPSEPTRLVETNKIIFDQTAHAWREQKLSGSALLEFASKQAQSYGYRLNPEMAGHRLSEFPHRVHSRKSLFAFKQTPKAHLWVLEIHLWDEGLERGAFYEDLLM